MSTNKSYSIDNFSPLVLAVALIIAAGLIMMGLTSAAQIMKEANTTNNKNIAVQGCFEVAQDKKITSGKPDKDNSWQVEETQINKQVVEDCLRQKGY